MMLLCKTPFYESIYNPKYNGYCLTCFIHLFPDEPNARNYKTKEKDIVDRITQSFTGFTWVADKKVQDGCCRRPYLLLLKLTKINTLIMIVVVNISVFCNYQFISKILLEIE